MGASASDIGFDFCTDCNISSVFWLPGEGDSAAAGMLAVAGAVASPATTRCPLQPESAAAHTIAIIKFLIFSFL